MINSTVPQESAGSLNSPGFMAYAILVIVTTSVAAVMNGLTIVPLAMAHSIPQPLRLFLINLLLAGLVVAFTVILSMGTSTILVAENSDQLTPPLYLCRAYLWLFAGGAAARLWSLTAFSLSVLAFVQFGKKTISPCFAAIITILWTVPWVLSLYILLPYVYEVQFVDGVACFPDNNNTIIIEARFTLFASWLTLGGIIPLTVSIIVPVVCLCYYIRRNIVTDGARYQKGMVKFSLFLVLGGVINVVGQVLPGLLGFFSAGPGVYFCYSIPAISLLPTPIIIVVFLKSVQEQVKKMLIVDMDVFYGRLTKAAICLI